MEIGAAGRADEAATGIRYAADFDTPINMITSSIAPTQWMDAGGPASIEAWDPTLDFVVAAPDQIHEEIEALFEKLRNMPVELDDQVGGRLLDQPSEIGPSDPPDFDSLHQLIINTVLPQKWNDVGGACSLEFDVPRLAAIVAADQETHAELTRLLTYLRRSRYALRHADRPWQADAQRGLLEGFGVTQFDSGLNASSLPRPRPEEIEALAVRRPVPAGQWNGAAPHSRAIAVSSLPSRRRDDFLQMDDPGRRIRCQGDAAAVAYPGLALVEFGDWGEAARRTIDERLPWLPHRSNAELARMFHVRRLAEKSSADVAVLRLTPAGFDESGGTYLQTTYGKKDGQPVLAEAYLAGRLTGTLRFAGPTVEGRGPTGQTVTLEDPSGTTLLEWQLVELRLKPVAVPSLAEGWDGYVPLDRRLPESTGNGGLPAVLAAIRGSDWQAAEEAIEIELQEQPNQPLLRFLRAWCLEQDRDAGTSAEMVNDLRVVAESPAVDLTRAVGEREFSRLSAAERYYVLSAQPPETRTAADWERLARAALSASQTEQALEHVRKSLQAADNDDGRFDRVLLHVNVLLRLQRNDEAVRVTQEWAGGGGGADRSVGEAGRRTG